MKIRLLRILVASPSGLEEERNATTIVVRQVNEMLAQRDVRFEVIRAERHVVPDVAERAQEVVNKQVQGYDVFLGMMGARFGTETGKAGSGTEEEFDEALGQRRNGKGALPKIMVYFKTAGIALADIEPDQLRKVNEFKRRMPSEGVFYGQFKSVSEFEDLLRIHLSTIALDLEQENGEVELSSVMEAESDVFENAIADVTDEWEIKDDDGFLELAEDAEIAMVGATQILVKYSEAMDKSVAIMNAANGEIAKEVEGGKPNVARAKSAIGRVVFEMNTFRGALVEMRPEYRQRLETGLRCYGKAAVIAKSFGQNFDEVYDKLKTLRKTMIIAHEAQRSLAKTIGLLPPITRDMNKARKSLAAEIDAFANDIEAGIRLMEVVEGLMRTTDSSGEAKAGV